MRFRSEFAIDGLDDLGPAGTATFEYGTAHQIVVSLDRKIDGKKETICGVTSQLEPAAHIADMFASLSQNLLPEGSMTSDEEPYFIESGSKLKAGTTPPLKVLPESFRSFAQQIESELESYAVRTVRVIRWRCGTLGPHDPIRSKKGTWWSFADQPWKAMPVDMQMHVSVSVSFPLTDEIRRQVRELVAEGRNEPLGQELYREAVELRVSNPRSALVIGVAAVETGLNQTIASLVPDARWLVENMPSPPVEVILREYLHQLPARTTFSGKVPFPNSAVLDALRKAVAIRNQIVHGKKVENQLQHPR